MTTKTDPLAIEAAAFMHAATALSGMLTLRLESVNPKGLHPNMLPEKERVIYHRLRMILLEVVSTRAVVRALRDDLTAEGLGGVGSGCAGAARNSNNHPQTESTQGPGESVDLDTGL